MAKSKKLSQEELSAVVKKNQERDKKTVQLIEKSADELHHRYEHERDQAGNCQGDPCRALVGHSHSQGGGLDGDRQTDRAVEPRR